MARLSRYAEIKRDYDKVARHTRRFPQSEGGRGEKNLTIKVRIERGSPGIDETPYFAKVCVVRPGHRLNSRCGYANGAGLKALSVRLTGSTKFRKKARKGQR